MTTAAQTHAQRNRGTLFVEIGDVTAIEKFAGEQVIMRIRVPKCSAAAKPGSFVHINCDDALPMRRPLSIMRVIDDQIDAGVDVNCIAVNKVPRRHLQRPDPRAKSVVPEPAAPLKALPKPESVA